MGRLYSLEQRLENLEKYSEMLKILDEQFIQYEKEQKELKKPKVLKQKKKTPQLAEDNKGN